MSSSHLSGVIISGCSAEIKARFFLYVDIEHEHAINGGGCLPPVSRIIKCPLRRSPSFPNNPIGRVCSENKSKGLMETTLMRYGDATRQLQSGICKQIA